MHLTCDRRHSVHGFTRAPKERPPALIVKDCCWWRWCCASQPGPRSTHVGGVLPRQCMQLRKATAPLAWWEGT